MPRKTYLYLRLIFTSLVAIINPNLCKFLFTRRGFSENKRRENCNLRNRIIGMTLRKLLYTWLEVLGIRLCGCIQRRLTRRHIDNTVSMRAVAEVLIKIQYTAWISNKNHLSTIRSCVGMKEFFKLQKDD